MYVLNNFYILKMLFFTFIVIYVLALPQLSCTVSRFSDIIEKHATLAVAITTVITSVLGSFMISQSVLAYMYDHRASLLQTLWTKPHCCHGYTVTTLPFTPSRMLLFCPQNDKPPQPPYGGFVYVQNHCWPVMFNEESVVFLLGAWLYQDLAKTLHIQSKF